MSAEEWISCSEMGRRIDRSETAVRKAARDGRFGKAAKRAADRTWSFEWPAAAREFQARTDSSRWNAKQLGAFVPTPELTSQASGVVLEVAGLALHSSLEKWSVWHHAERGTVILPVALAERVMDDADAPAVAELTALTRAIIWVVTGKLDGLSGDAILNAIEVPT